MVDAAGFGPGHRTEPSRGVGRVLVWSTVGAVSAGVLISVIWSAIAMLNPALTGIPPWKNPGVWRT